MNEQTIKHIGLTMVRKHLASIPEASLSAPYGMRAFRPGDETHWAEIECAAGEFPNAGEALAHFKREFGAAQKEMEQRCLFVIDGGGKPVATTTAWYGEMEGMRIGRIHWVAVTPEHQGRKLANPLLSQALRVMTAHHERAYLTTQTTSWKAINMYLKFGFEPLVRGQDCIEGWRLMERLLQTRILTGSGTEHLG